ncbi:MAG: c-type cytochrome [Acidobacteriota bacterium]
MNKKWIVAASAVTLGVYLSAIAIGMHVRDFTWLDYPQHRQWTEWQAPRLMNAPQTPLGESIRYGARLFNETPLYAPSNAGNRLACTSCHSAGGIQPYASPMVGLPTIFPTFNQRAGRVISLQDRIQECFVRSENGKPLSYTSKEMHALMDYIAWLSEPQPKRAKFKGRGLASLPPLTPDPQNGAAVYATQCAGCHGTRGEGSPLQFPPLWGPQSYNDGAGMDHYPRVVGFVQRNMPRGVDPMHPQLTLQQAWDVAAYVISMPRPHAKASVR